MSGPPPTCGVQDLDDLERLMNDIMSKVVDAS